MDMPGYAPIYPGIRALFARSARNQRGRLQIRRRHRESPSPDRQNPVWLSSDETDAGDIEPIDDFTAHPIHYPLSTWAPPTLSALQPRTRSSCWRLYLRSGSLAGALSRAQTAGRKETGSLPLS